MVFEIWCSRFLECTESFTHLLAHGQTGLQHASCTVFQQWWRHKIVDLKTVDQVNKAKIHSACSNLPVANTVPTLYCLCYALSVYCLNVTADDDWSMSQIPRQRLANQYSVYCMRFLTHEWTAGEK